MSGDNDTFERHFDSVIDFLDDSMDGKLCYEPNRDFYNYQRNRKESDWYGIPDREVGVSELYQLVKNGWADGAQKVERLSREIEIEQFPVVRRRRVWADQGDELIMDRLYAGALDVAWRRARKALCAGVPRIRIVVNMFTPADTDGSDMFWPGAAAIVLADRLVEAGYHVQMVSAVAGADWLNGRAPHNVLYSCIAKDWLMPIEISGIASTTALAGMFRKFGFLQIIKIAPNEIFSGVCTPGKIIPQQFSYGADKTLVVNGCNSKLSAMSWLSKSIAEIKKMTAN